jgi:hypothetical protein
MNLGIAGKVADFLNDHRSRLAFGTAIIAASAALVIALNYIIPPQYRACALMRGFCVERNEARKPKQFEEIGNMRGNGVKFDLSPYSRKLH